MRSKASTAALAIVLGFLIVTNPVIADAAKQITGKQIKNDSITGKDVKESTLKKVPKAKKADRAKKATRAKRATQADRLSVAPPGSVQSGAFSTAAGSPQAGYVGFGISYPRPLATAIDEDNIIDTVTVPDPVNCPGAGQAAPGYLCLYFNHHSGITKAFGWSTDGPLGQTDLSYGASIYAPTDGAGFPYADGLWSVGAPQP